MHTDQRALRRSVQVASTWRSGLRIGNSGSVWPAASQQNQVHSRDHPLATLDAYDPTVTVTLTVTAMVTATAAAPGAGRVTLPWPQEGHITASLQSILDSMDLSHSEWAEMGLPGGPEGAISCTGQALLCRVDEIRLWNTRFQSRTIRTLQKERVRGNESALMVALMSFCRCGATSRR